MASAAIRAVLAANAAPAVLQCYDDDLDAAYEQACEKGDLTPLVQTVRRWWFEADAWRDPGAQRQFLVRLDSYRNEGLPPSAERMTRQGIRARFGRLSRLAGQRHPGDGRTTLGHACGRE